MPTKISPCLWFDHQAEDASRFYTTIFKDSKIVAISHYPEAGREIHGKPPGSVMTVAFELNGQSSAIDRSPPPREGRLSAFGGRKAPIDKIWKTSYLSGGKATCFAACSARPGPSPQS
jgi:predicted 3-demethylubiquinone-9 3-methyltransferase (glyoxalase superfamily)